MSESWKKSWALSSTSKARAPQGKGAFSAVNSIAALVSPWAAEKWSCTLAETQAHVSTVCVTPGPCSDAVCGGSLNTKQYFAVEKTRVTSQPQSGLEDGTWECTNI